MIGKEKLLDKLSRWSVVHGKEVPREICVEGKVIKLKGPVLALADMYKDGVDVSKEAKELYNQLEGYFNTFCDNLRKEEDKSKWKDIYYSAAGTRRAMVILKKLF